MVDMLDRPLLGYRADGRPVLLVRGGAEEGDGATTPAPATGAPAAPIAAEGAAAEGAGDGAEEIEFSEEAFKALIDKHNALQSERESERAKAEAEQEELRKKLHAASQDASKHRQRARQLAELMAADGGTGKPATKSAAAAKAAAADADASQADARLAELSEQLEAARRGSLLSGARAALAEAGVPKSAIAAAVRMVDLGALELGTTGEVAGLDEQIDALRQAVPQLFAPPLAPLAATAASGNGTGSPARVLRAAPAVAGRGAAGRGGEAPKPPTTADILANRLLGKSDE